MAATEREYENLTVAQELFRRLNEHDSDVIEDLYVPSYSADIQRVGIEEPVSGIEGIKTIYEEYWAAFPDMAYESDAMLADGKRVAVFYTVTGTHENTFRGIEATGTEVEFTGSTLMTVKQGRILSVRPQLDVLSLFRQLGVDLELDA